MWGNYLECCIKRKGDLKYDIKRDKERIRKYKNV